MKFRPCIDLHEGVVKQIVGGSLRDTATVAAVGAAAAAAVGAAAAATGGGGAPVAAAAATPAAAASAGVVGAAAAAIAAPSDAAAASSSAVTNFVATQPAEYFARMYAADGLRGGHVIMLGAGNDAPARAALAAFPGGMQVGGGVTAANAASWIEAGASHVIVTSAVFRGGAIDWDRLRELEGVVGKDHLVLDLSCRKRPRADGGHEYVVVTDRWQKYTDCVVSAETLRVLAAHCDEFLVHGVDVEGLRAGIEDDLVRLLGDASPIPVTYAGGVRDLHDVERVRRLGGGRVDVSIGSALDVFGGSLPYADVVAATTSP